MFPSLPFSVSYFHFSQFSIPDTIQINQSTSTSIPPSLSLPPGVNEAALVAGHQRGNLRCNFAVENQRAALGRCDNRDLSCGVDRILIRG